MTATSLPDSYRSRDVSQLLQEVRERCGRPVLPRSAFSPSENVPEDGIRSPFSTTPIDQDVGRRVERTYASFANESEWMNYCVENFTRHKKRIPLELMRPTHLRPTIVSQYPRVNYTKAENIKKSCVIQVFEKIKEFIRKIMAALSGFRCLEKTAAQLKAFDEQYAVPNSEATRARIVKVFKEKHACKNAMRSTGNVALGVSEGASLGALIGMPGGPIGMAIGGGIGTIVGTIFGVAKADVETKVKYYEFERREMKVHRENIAQHYKAALIDFHKEHEEMEEFCCPITSEFFVNPVMTPYGDTYERSAITRFIREKEAMIRENPNLDLNITDPQRKGILSTQDLKKDYVMIMKMHMAYSDLVANNILLPNVSQHVKDGLYLIKRDLDKQIEEIYQDIRRLTGNNFRQAVASGDIIAHMERERDEVMHIIGCVRETRHHAVMREIAKVLDENE